MFGEKRYVFGELLQRRWTHKRILLTKQQRIQMMMRKKTSKTTKIREKYSGLNRS